MDGDELIAALAGDDDTALRALLTRHAPWLAAGQREALPRGDVEDARRSLGCLAADQPARGAPAERYAWPALNCDPALLTDLQIEPR